MELPAATITTYLRHPLEQLLVVADGLGDDGVNERPLGPGTNSVAALVVHCCGMLEFWVGHVALGRPTGRDRDAEFTATATLDELHALVDETVARLEGDVAAIDAGDALANEAREFLLAGDGSDADLLVYVVHELYQHLGHAEVTADALSSRS